MLADILKELSKVYELIVTQTKHIITLFIEISSVPTHTAPVNMEEVRPEQKNTSGPGRE